MNKNKQLMTVGKIFLISVVVLTFLSKTIASELMTKVTAEYPKYQALIKQSTAEGEMKIAEEYTLYAPIEGKVKSVLVEVNQQVEEGELVCILDLSDKKYELEENRLNQQKNQLQLESNQAKMSSLKAKLEDVKVQMQDLEKAEDESDSISLSDQLTIQKLEESVFIQEELYQSGAVAEIKWKEAKQELEQKQAEIAEKEEEERISKEKEKQVEQKSYKEKLDSIYTELATILENNKILEIEAKQLQLSQEKLVKLLEDDGRVYATKAGRVNQINLQEGQSISSGSELCKIGITDKGYRVEVSVDSKIDFIAIGDEVEMTVPSLQRIDVKGMIKEIKKESKEQKVEIVVNEPNLQGGEKVKVRFAQKSKEEYKMISYAALHKDEKGYFIYLLKQTSTPLGDDYIVTRHNVNVIDYTESYAAISDMLQDNEFILVSSEKAVKVGERVKVENEAELLCGS